MDSDIQFGGIKLLTIAPIEMTPNVVAQPSIGRMK